MTHTVRHRSFWPVYLALGLFVLVTLVFVIEFSRETALLTGAELTTAPDTAELEARALALLQDADPARGARLVDEYRCTACHRAPDARLAPPYVGVAERAVTRHPPLSAAAYLYESIVDPLAYIVEDYVPAMPQDYPQRITDQELGDILAYLLTPDAQ